MASQEGILAEIRELTVGIQELETQSKKTSDEDLKKRNDTKISDKTKLLIAKQETLTALINSQQGKFHHIFPLLFPNPLDVTLCPMTLDISSSPILVMVNTQGKS